MEQARFLLLNAIPYDESTGDLEEAEPSPCCAGLLATDDAVSAGASSETQEASSETQKASSETQNVLRHLLLHASSGRTLYKCTVCDELFFTFALVKTHFKVHGKCTLCGKPHHSSPALKRCTCSSPSDVTHPCPECHRSFRDKKAMKSHRRIHGTKNLDNMCNYCGMIFSTLNGLKNHIVLRHYEQLLAGVESSESNRDTSYQCQFCLKFFVNWDFYEHHLEKHNEVDPLTTETEQLPEAKVCEKCGLTLPSEHELKQHLVLFCAGNKKSLVDTTADEASAIQSIIDEIIKTESIPQGAPITSLYNEKRRYQCGYCSKTFASCESLILHSESHRRYACGLCTKAFLKKSLLKSHITTHGKDILDSINEEKVSCACCGKIFINSHHLKQHSASFCSGTKSVFTSSDVSVSENNEKSTACDNAPLLAPVIPGSPEIVPTTNEDDVSKAENNPEFNPCPEKSALFLQKHLPNQCPNCGKICTAQDLRQHIDLFCDRRKKSYSLGVGHFPSDSPNASRKSNPLYQCWYCQRYLGDWDSLKQHLLSHRGHKCTQCPKSFHTSKGLRNHIGSRHGRVTCIHCGSGLKDHGRDCRPSFRCPVCLRIFGGKRKINNHIMKMHKKRKLYVSRGRKKTNAGYLCVICNEKFETQTDYTQHTRDLNCVSCELSFESPVSLEQHLKRHELLQCLLCNKQMRQPCFFKLHQGACVGVVAEEDVSSESIPPMSEN